MNISVDDFISFHKTQTQPQEAIEEDTKVFSFQAKKMPRAIRPLKAGCNWGDLSDSESESESECESVISVKVTVELPKMEPTPEEQFEDAYEEPEQKPEVKPEQKPEVKHEQKPEPEKKSSEMKWLTTVKKHAPVQQKTQHPKQEAKTQKSKQKLEVVEDVQQFISFIREGKKPEQDFTIAPEAHCHHTFKGEICEKVFECGKIHIQRCIHFDNCTKRRCTYLHPWDMDSAESEELFVRTMRKYNNRKQNKQNKQVRA
jgi:hypothetical protein